MALRGRTLAVASACTGIGVVVALLWPTAVFELGVRAGLEPRYIPVAELVPVMLTAVVALGAASRMPLLDRLGDRRRTVPVSVATAALVFAVPLAVLACISVQLPAEFSVSNQVANTLFAAAIVLIASRAFDAVVGAPLAVAVYFLLLALQQATPAARPWIPIAYAQAPPRWPLLAALAIAATLWWIIGAGVPRTSYRSP